MVGNQADYVADLIASLNRKRLKTEEFSASDDGENTDTNRGNKLKRNARYVYKGSLPGAEGITAHPEEITHATYTRKIIHRNPKRYDEDGVELSDSESDDYADAAADGNPYHDVHIERILEPLMQASDLPTNPVYSYPYTSTALTEMVQSAEKQLQEAKTALWKAKNILTELRGDEIWVPGGAVESDDDFDLFYPKKSKLGTDTAPRHKSKHHTTNHLETQQSVVAEERRSTKADMVQDIEVSQNNVNRQQALDVEMADAPTNDDPFEAPNEYTTEDSAAKDATEPAEVRATETNDESQGVKITGDPDAQDATASDHINGIQPTGESPKDDSPEILEKILSKDNETVTGDSIARGGSQAESNPDEATPPPPRRMTTRAQAQAASNSLDTSNSSSRTRSQSPATSTFSSNYVDPLYLLPAFAIPDRDFGLPAGEADEVRRLLMSYIQKQEEVVRGCEKIFEGLSRADRCRKLIYEWCKADGHTGEMSDGEDWYDKEYWGLEEDLRKGADDEEEVEAAVPGDNRKRRGRK